MSYVKILKLFTAFVVAADVILCLTIIGELLHV